MTLLFVRGYYAMGNTRKPLIAGLSSGFMVIFLSFVFLKIFNSFDMFRYFIESLLRLDNIPETAVLMLPLGYSLALIGNCVLLGVYFHRDFRDFYKAISKTSFQVFNASIIMGFVTYLGLNIFDDIFNLNKLVGIFSQGLFSGLIGIFVFILTLKLLKNKEIDEIWKTMHRKIWKVKPIAPDVPEL